MSTPTYSEEIEHALQTAIKAADAARKTTQKWFRADMSIEVKHDQSPVTIADRETEEVIKKLIQTHHPEHGFYGEETGKIQQQSDWLWVIDPIDGTKSFATGKPSFGTLISLCHKNRPVLGIIDQSILNERWVGIQQEYSKFNDAPCKTSNKKRLKDCVSYTTTIDMFNEHNIKQAESLTKQCQFRVFGGDCYAYGLLCLGLVDLVCEANLKPYDYMALVPVIEGAGGIISDWQGNPLGMESTGEVIACASTELHQQSIDILNQV